MNLYYNPYYFQKANPNIQGNVDLRTPQINGYYKVYEHFMVNGKTNSAILVLPMGVGKTGLIGLLPYSICEGRALVITPQITIKDTIVDSLDPYKADNFWLKRNVFKNLNELPALVEYDGSDTPIEVLEYANIVVINIQKLQQRFDSSLLNRLPHDFFDIIIIDEAHHSTAQTWIDTINYFSKAKVVKLTGTPYRTDNEEITGELVYYYTLGQAMANNYVKQLDHIVYIPEKLLLTLDEDQTKTYTVEEIYEMGIKDEDWVSRSVAYSLDCSERIVDESLKLLEQKLLVSDLPHKIIAVACSIKHAEEIKNLYESKGYKTTIIHSDMNGTLKEQAFNDIKNDRVQVVVNVAMLGEGYDHNYLSIAAIFRPFRSKLPYAQFIGRILRVIPEDKVQSPSDNV
ncbi:MAG TPA: restriction endonuclease subunit R, partial [Firmicutes bacterium]|nr:restriction endonuclease subunit R [Bacillota bacterium]